MASRRGGAGGRTEPGSPATSLSTVWVAAAVLVPAIAITLVPLQAVDLAYSLRAGAAMLESGSVLRVDGFTLTGGGSEWLNQQWGGQLALELAFRAGGWLGLALLRTLLALATTTLAYLACRAGGTSRRGAAALTLAGSAFYLGGFVLRPQLLGMTCFALVLWLTARRREHPSLLWLAIPVILLWANVHGSFVLGPVWLGLAALRDLAAGRGARSAAWAAIAAAAAAACNPFGVRVYGYVVTLSTDPIIRRTIREWRPPTLDPRAGSVFALSLLFLASVVGAIWSVARTKERTRAVAVVTLAVAALPGALSIRGMYWWGLSAPVILAEAGVLRAEARAAEPARIANTVLVGAFVAALLAAAARWLPYPHREPIPAAMLTYAPQEVTETLRKVLEPGEPLFNAQLWGSWFEFALPGHPVFADARIEVIPRSAWSDYEAVSAARRDWASILDRWGIRVVAARNDQQGPLIQALREDPSWSQAYLGEGGAVFVREPTDDSS